MRTYTQVIDSPTWALRESRRRGPSLWCI